MPVDITDPDGLERAAATIRSEPGPVDIVVANAGAMLAAPFESAATEEWDRMLDVNVRGLLRTGRAFAGDLIAAAADGRAADLVHVGSIGGHEVFPGYAVYGATKAAVAHLTRNLRASSAHAACACGRSSPGWSPPSWATIWPMPATGRRWVRCARRSGPCRPRTSPRRSRSPWPRPRG